MSASLTQRARDILLTSEADSKARLTLELVEDWNSGKIAEIGEVEPVVYPARPPEVKILLPHEMPKRGKGGTPEHRLAMLHSLTHIESMAIDLAWDIITRFKQSVTNLPKEFFDDFVRIAGEEAKHYTILRTRLEQIGHKYGDLPAHDGLWESAMESKDDILVRLAIENMVHEARGLDVVPGTIQRFRSAGDKETAILIENNILPDEITHVTAGVKWFTYLCKRDNKEPIKEFIDLVPRHFKGVLKAPFNTAARTKAGMSEEWYLPLTTRPSTDKSTTVNV